MPNSKPSGSKRSRRYRSRLAGLFGVGERRLSLTPFVGELKGYGGRTVASDLRAGLNVALLAFPQGMAYALVAGLPIHFGITCSVIAAFLAPFLAASRHTILGPTNATAFMVFSFFAASTAAQAVHLMPLLVLMVGVLLVVGAVTRVADLIGYVSRAVIVGYIAGASLLIIANQLRHVLGVEASGGRSFFTIAWGTLTQLNATQWPTLLLGVGTAVLYLTLGKMLRGWPNFAITLVVATAVAAGMAKGDPSMAVATFGAIELGALLPDLSVFGDADIFDHITQLSGLAFGLAFLAALENSVMSKSLASRTGDRPDMNQDMLGVGVANLGCSFLSGMVASGSLTRSALNYASGAATRLSSIFSAVFCGLGLFLLAPMIQYVPKCALAALVIVVAMTLINARQLRICWRATPGDAATLAVTFFAALTLPLHVAIFIGVGTAVALFLRQAARPELVEYDFGASGELNELREGEKRSLPAISIVHVEGELFFGAAELFRRQIQATATDPSLKVIVLRMKNARHLDATSVIALEDLVRFLRDNDRELIISGVMKDVYRVLKNAGAVEVIGKENIFPGSVDNPNLATRNALKRAREILGDGQIDVRIFP